MKSRCGGSLPDRRRNSHCTLATEFLCLNWRTQNAFLCPKAIFYSARRAFGGREENFLQEFWNVFSVCVMVHTNLRSRACLPFCFRRKVLPFFLLPNIAIFFLFFIYVEYSVAVQRTYALEVGRTERKPIPLLHRVLTCPPPPKKKSRVGRNVEDGPDDVYGRQTYRLRIALEVTDPHCCVLGQVALGRNATSFHFAPGAVC